MTNTEILTVVQDLVQTFGTVDAALKAVHDTPFPRKKNTSRSCCRSGCVHTAITQYRSIDMIARQGIHALPFCTIEELLSEKYEQ